MLNRGSLLKWAGAIAATVMIPQTPSRAAEPSKKPNIISILSDDCGIGGVACYGSDRFKTPNPGAKAAKVRLQAVLDTLHPQTAAAATRPARKKPRKKGRQERTKVTAIQRRASSVAVRGMGRLDYRDAQVYRF